MLHKDVKAIREKLGHMALDWTPTEYLNTGIEDLNAVLGHKTRGLAYGRITEMQGWESQGKSAIVMSLAALAQHDGAQVIWGDLENSFDYDWAKTRGFVRCLKCGGKPQDSECSACYDKRTRENTGLDMNKLLLVKPYVGTFTEVVKGKKKICAPRLSTGEALCGEIEACMGLPGFKKRFVVLDSIAALLTDAEAAAGIEGSNMKTSMALSVFLGKLLRRWVGLAEVYNAQIILVNQLRTGPAAFGDPTYAVGGNAPRFYSHVRVRVNRVLGGKITDKGKLIGISGLMRCLKNKTGGSEGLRIGYRIMFNGPVEFVKAKELETKKDEE